MFGMRDVVPGALLRVERMRRVGLIGLAALAGLVGGCASHAATAKGGATTPPGPSTPTGPVAGCPGAAAVHLAWFLPPSATNDHSHSGWVLPLHDAVVSTIDGLPAYTTLDAAAASAAGVPAPPPSVWLLQPDAAPCRAITGGYFGAADDAGTPNVAYGVELTGCPAPSEHEDASAIAVVSELPPTECQMLVPRPVAARLGDEQAGAWHVPVKQTPVPAAVAAAVPAHVCVAPACQALWAVAEIDHADHPVAYTGAFNWITIPPGAAAATQCDWKSEHFSGFFTVGADGAATQVTAGMEHPLPLVAALADRTGVKVLFAAGPGEYATYDLAAGTATLGRHLVWLAPATDAFAHIDSLGPSCGR